MTLLAGDVIESARDRHVAFDRERAPQGMCLRLLSQSVRELLGKVAAIDEDALRVEQNVVMPLPVFADGIALPANRAVVAVTVEETGVNPRNFDLDIVPAAMRNDINTPMSAAWQIGSTLYLRGRAEDWTNIASVAVATVPVPAVVAASTDQLPVDDTAEAALASNLALKLAMRGSPMPDGVALNVQVFAAAAADAETSYLNEVRNRVTNRVFQTRDVMNYFDS